MPLNDSDRRFFEWLGKAQVEADPKTKNQTPSIHEMRAATKVLDPFVDSPADLPFKDNEIVAHAGHRIRLRYYASDSRLKPLIIFFPGNAFIYDCFEINHTIISKIAKTAECHAVMVECRLAPEHPYPEPLEDATEAVNYIHNHLHAFHPNFPKNYR